ncbi:MAG: glutamate--tRNA ligase family protein [Candidimonas sp.]
MTYITRIAPSPTGDMHLGTARTAYFNWLAARSTGGKFILRIDDTDLERSKDEHISQIIDVLDWLNLDYDLFVRQSSRLDRYTIVANELIKNGHAMIVDGNAIALKYPDNMIRSWTDTVCGDVDITDKSRSIIHGLILIKSNGMPTYHFASVVDDIDFGVNFIIRGVDHVSNTALHAAIYHVLGQKLPKMAHVGLILKDKKKLSKRDGAASMLSYRDQGIDPDAMLNFMLRLGWGPQNENKSHAIIDRKKALDLFLDHGNMRPTNSNMDSNHLSSYDKKYKRMKEK